MVMVMASGKFKTLTRSLPPSWHHRAPHDRVLKDASSYPDGSLLIIRTGLLSFCMSVTILGTAVLLYLQRIR